MRMNSLSSPAKARLLEIAMAERRTPAAQAIVTLELALLGVPRTTAADLITAHLRVHGPQSAANIARATGLAPGGIYTLLTRLVARGLIERGAGWDYSLCLHSQNPGISSSLGSPANS